MRASRNALLWLSVFVSLAVSSGVKAQTVVDTCGQIVNGAGVLGGDLDCSAESVEFAVLISGTLDLQGFTLTEPAAGNAIGCPGKCRIRGPGLVRGGIRSGGGIVKLLDLAMEGTQPYAWAVSHPVKLKALRVTVSGYDNGFDAVTPAIVDCQLTGSSLIGGGVSCQRTKLVRSSVTGFGGGGVAAALSPRLVDSNVTGNGIDPSCPGNCVDIISGGLPTLRGTSTCGTSAELYTGTPWGVCSGD